MTNKNKLKGRIAAAGMSQADLAKAIKMSENTMTAKLNGRSVFRCDEVDRICEALDITDPAEKVEIFLLNLSQKRDKPGGLPGGKEGKKMAITWKEAFDHYPNGGV